MTVREAHDAWGEYSENCIREFCQYEFIPMAKKDPVFKYSRIPDDAEKPPVSAHSFIVLMESIAEFKAGGNPNVCRKGLPKHKVKDALYYLSGFGFIKEYDEKLEYPEILKRVSLMGKAYIIINKYRKKNNLPDIEVNIGAELNAAEVVKIHGEKKISY